MSSRLVRKPNHGDVASITFSHFNLEDFQEHQMVGDCARKLQTISGEASTQLRMTPLTTHLAYKKVHGEF